MLGTGPYPIISGSTPANANETNFALIGRFNSFALLSDANIAAVAPSFKPAAFPVKPFVRADDFQLPARRHFDFRPEPQLLPPHRGEQADNA